MIVLGKRVALSRSGSKRLYSGTSRPHPKNVSARPMRGGIRL